jgi:Tol biopolymer transport system component
MSQYLGDAMIKQILIPQLLCFLLTTLCFAQVENKLELAIKAETFQALLLPIICNQDSDLCKQLVKDLRFSGQIEPTMMSGNFSKSVCKKLAQEGYGLTLFIKETAESVDWALHDNFARENLVSKSLSKKQSASQLAHQINDGLWPILFSQNSSFNTVIAAVKKNGNKKSQVFVLYPFEDLKPKAISKGVANCFAPRFHPTQNVLYYSQHTKTNARLVGYTPELKEPFLVSNCLGMNMTPTISQQGQVALSLAPHGNTGLYLQTKNNNKHQYQRLSNGEMQVISPQFINENEILCCAFYNNRPYVSIYNFGEQKIKKYFDFKSLAPMYCAVKNQIFYVKNVDGCLQIFVFDRNAAKHSQITNTKTNKDHPWASPCGNYLVFTEFSDKSARIVLLNLNNLTQHYLTPANENWESPVWSPSYINRFA